MEEKMEELYQNYLTEKLDLIFNSGIGENINVDAITKDYLELVLDYSYISTSEGYTLVKKNDKYNFIDMTGKLISSEWYDKAFSFCEGYAEVRKNDKYNFIDKTGKLISSEWYDDISIFWEGYAKVKKNDKYNFIDRTGKLISGEWYEDISSFCEGYAEVRKNNKYNFIDRTSKSISSEWYDDISSFREGYAKVQSNNKHNFIDKMGNLLLKEWPNYQIAADFHEGYALVENDNKYNFIDKTGNLLFEKWLNYQLVESFHEGYALVKNNNKYNFIDKTGNLLFIEWPNYQFVDSFHEGYAVVIENSKYNFIDKTGNLLLKDWYDYASDFENYASDFEKKRAIVKKNDNKYNFIDKTGNLLLKEWYDDINYLYEGYARVKGNYKYNYIDKTGSLLSKDWYEDKKNSKKNCENYILSKMNNYNVKKKLFGGYKCFNSYDKFSIKYKPIKDYGIIYVLCINENNFYLYNRKTKEYKNIGTNIVYNDLFIYNNDKVYFIYNDKKIDITDYYTNNLIEHLMNNNTLNITPNIEILSKVDFDYLNSEEKNKFLIEEKEKNKKIKEEQEKLKQDQDIENAEKEKKEQQEKLNLELVDTLITLKDSINKLNELKKRLGNIKIQKIIVDNILVDIDDHKEIMNELKDKLQFIDLSIISFKDVDISGIDFKGCNIHLFPQEVYKKDLRDCDFTGINIDPFMNFRGVDIRGAKFSMDSNPSTLDVMPNFAGAIYDETTTYNGKSLVEILGSCEEINNKKMK